MHRLSASFILGYHGCDRAVGEKLLRGEPFRESNNGYDWLGPGVYFWEANPQRALEFARECAARTSEPKNPFVVGAVIEMGLCLDLTTSAGVEWMRIAYDSLLEFTQAARFGLPANSTDQLRRNLDCAVMRRLHVMLEREKQPAVDTLKGVFAEGSPAYPGAGFAEKTHIQVAVRNLRCIKGVFRVPTT